MGCPFVGSPGLGIHRDTVKKYMNAESPPNGARAREVDGIVI